MIELKSFFDLRNLSVNIDIWSKEKGKFLETTAVFDTGATITHISTSFLQYLGYGIDVNSAGKSYVSTIGNSKMRINNTAIDNIRLDTLELGAVAVNFSDMSDINASVILGMNILKEFNINLDFENELITMKPTFDF